MKGYYTNNGFYGFIDGDYCYYASQSDYYNEMEGRGCRSSELETYASSLYDDLWD